jgi:hypothetical protein
MDQKTEKKPTPSPMPDQQSGDGVAATQQGHANSVADEDQALSRGDLVLSRDGHLLPAGDPALVSGDTPARPPTAALSVALPSPIKKLAVSSDGLRIVGIDRNRTVFAWSAQDLTPIVEGGSPERYTSLLGRATEASERLDDAVTKSRVEIYEHGSQMWAKWPNQEPILLLERMTSPCSVGMSDDGRYTAVIESYLPGTGVYVFETEHLLRASEWNDPSDLASEAIGIYPFDDGDFWSYTVFSPDGQKLAVSWVGFDEYWVRVWDFHKNEHNSFGGITAFAFLGNEKLVVARGNEIQVLDLELHAVET